MMLYVSYLFVTILTFSAALAMKESQTVAVSITHNFAVTNSLQNWAYQLVIHCK